MSNDVPVQCKGWVDTVDERCKEHTRRRWSNKPTEEETAIVWGGLQLQDVFYSIPGADETDEYSDVYPTAIDKLTEYFSTRAAKVPTHLNDYELIWNWFDFTRKREMWHCVVTLICIFTIRVSISWTVKSQVHYSCHLINKVIGLEKKDYIWWFTRSF